MVRSLLLAALFVPAHTSAQVIMTEIMYDLAEGSDAGREWIEVYNAGSAPVVLTELTLFESKRKHGITSETNMVPPFAHAIIADKPEKFRADYPAYVGLIFDSAFSLNNEGEVLELRRGDTVVDTASYLQSHGGNGSGESLQRTVLSPGTSFSPGAPTPGAPIPTSGLLRIAKPSKSKKMTAASTDMVASRAPEVLGTYTAHRTFEPFELERETAGLGLWLLGVAAIASVGITGAVLGRMRDELDLWTIIEET